MINFFQSKVSFNKKVFLAAAAIIMIGGFFVATILAQAGTPSTIYVDVNVEVPGDGTTLESAFKTIQGAINAASAGDTIIVAAGTYTYVSEGSPAASGLIKVTKGLTIKAAEGVRPVIDGSGFDGVFKIHPSALNPGDTVIIEGFEIIGDATTGTAITMQGCFDEIPAHVVINDNWFHGMIGGIDFWGAGSYLPLGWTSAVANVEISNNKFYDMVINPSGSEQGFGVLLENASNWATAGNDYAYKITGNEFSNMPSNGANPGIGIAIDAINDPLQTANIYMSDNIFTTVPVGIFINDGDVTNTKIENNSFVSNPFYAILAQNISGSPVNARHNWWGSNVKSEIDALISGDVDYKFWYMDEGMEEINYPPVHNTTQDAYYDTIQGAIDAATAGDMIIVADGTYTYESEGLPDPAGLIKISKPITIKAADGVRPIIDGTGFDGVFKIWASTFFTGQVIIEGFEITGDSVTDIAITSAMKANEIGDATEIIIRNNWFHGMNAGIDFWGTGGGYVSKIQIVDNKFYDMGETGITQGYGILLEGLASRTTIGDVYAAIVEQNEFYNIYNGTDTNYGYGIAAQGGAANMYIANNKFSTVSVGTALISADVTNTRIILNDINTTILGVMTQNITNSPVDATENWWGSANPNFTEVVSANVDYSPWLGAEPATSPMTWYTNDSIQDAINAASAGDTINVAAGTYTANLTINKSLILQGAGSESTKINVADNTAVTITADNVTINGFEITRSASANAEDDIGILLNQADGATIENNNIHDNAVGIEVLDSANNTIQTNIITTNAIGIYFEGTTDEKGATPEIPETDNGPFYSLSLGNTISGNIISNSFKFGGEQGHGIYLDAACENNNFSDNTITNNESNGIYAWKASNNDYSDNIITGNGSAGFELMGSSNNTISSSTISNNNYGLYIRSGALSSTNNTITNNIISTNAAVGIYLKDSQASGYIGIVNGNTINSNSIYGSTLNAKTEETPEGDIYNMENNYWGTDYPVFATIVSANVDYDPWYFDPTMEQSSTQIATIFQGIATTLSSSGITSNIGDATASNFKSFSNLYFEKSIDGVKMGKIEFTSALDLSSDATTNFLKALGDRMDANQPGVIGLNFAGLTEDPSLKGVGAEIIFYGLNALFPSGTTADEINSKLIARNDDGTIVADKTSLIPAPGTYDAGNNIFTINVVHFTKYEIDNTPPAKATFSADKTAATNTNVAVTITYPADATTKLYAINDGAYENYTGSVVMAQNGTVLAKSSDLVGNESEVAQYNITNIDKTALAPSSLSAGSATANSLTLSWTNTESNGSLYTIKQSTSEITADNFAAATSLGNAPTPASGSQGYVAKNLIANTTYYFAIKITDTLGNVSDIATISGKTLAAAAVSTDTVAPGAIGDLAAQAGTTATSQIKLTWTATGDDGATGIATKYVIKRSTGAITTDNFDAATTVFNSMSPQSAGSSETFTVTGLTAGTTYYFAVKAQDEAGNTSTISNGPVSLATTANLPTVASISPNSGQNDGAVAITVTGTNFVDGANTLRLSNSSNSFDLAATYVSATSLTASVPMGAPVGIYNLKVVNNNGTSAALASAYEVKAAPIPLPTVTDVIPSTISTTDTNISVEIIGANLLNATAVNLDDAGGTALTINTNTATKITATLAAAPAAGNYNVKITTAGGINTISSVKLNVKAPVVIDSSTLEQTTSDPIDLSTTNTIPVQITMQSDDTIVNTETVGTIEVVIPPATEVKGADGNAYTGNINPPQIVKPTEEIIAKAGADAVVITMGNPDQKITFSNDFVTTVTLETTNTKAPLIWYYKADGTLELAGKAGTKDGVTYIAGGTVLNTVNNGSIYTYTIGILMDHMSSYVAGVNPTISSISPSSLRAGYSITINGTNFSPTNTVKFGNTEISATSGDSTSISIVVPALSPMNYNITVVNSDGLISNSYGFTIEATGGAVISSGGGGGGGSTSSNSQNNNQTTAQTPTLPSVRPQVLGEKVYADSQLEQILTDSAAVYSENIDTILANAKAVRSANSEKNTSDKYLNNLTHNEKNFLPAEANRLNFFITYGTAGTKILGAGERAGVINSYKAAFGKLPKTEAEWQDAIKIANGRWPSARSEAALTKAQTTFKAIYGREADMNNANDNAAVTVMAYGLRPSLRNLNSEKAAILAFKYFIKHAPTTAIDWDTVRAIAYSGAKR